YGPAVNNTAFYHSFYQTSVVSGSYNSLQARISGTFGGVTLLGSYTWSHSLDNGADPLAPGAGGAAYPRNSFDLGPEYGNSDYDVRNRGTVSVVYDLPVGLGRPYLNSGFLGHVFEGIEIAGIQQAQSGLP